MEKVNIVKIWLSEDAVWIRTNDGKEACEKFSDYPRLRFATTEQLQDYKSDTFGIHWPQLDEDLFFEGFFKTKSTNVLYGLFMNHPELNASAIARRLNISQSLFAQYISGGKKPSKEREAMILEEIRSMGRQLSAI